MYFYVHAGADHNSVDNNGDTLLRYAIDGDCSKEVLQVIVESGVDVNVRNKGGNNSINGGFQTGKYRCHKCTSAYWS